MLRLSLALVCAIALLGCGKKSSPPAAGSGSGSGSAPVATTADAGTAADAGATARTPTPRTKPTAIPKAVRAEYKKRLAAGRKASKAARWPEAITELEAALAAIPGDDRALAELSWAALSAGDHDKARKAGRQAALAATEPKIKAAALYNLGRVDEGTDAAKAAALYQESLALRPNKIVEQRLADLKAKVAIAPDPLPCTTPATAEKVCACLAATSTDLDPGARGCDLTPTGLDDFQVATYRQSDLGEDNVALLARAGAGWAVVELLAYVYNPGAFGVSEEWSLESATDEKLGDKSIARFVTKKSRRDADMGLDEEEHEDSTTLFVCVRGAAGQPPTCPLEVRTDYEYVRDSLGLAEEGDLGDVSDLRTKDLPIKSRTTLEVTLNPDGVAKIRAVRGRVEPAELGDKKLW